MNRTHKPRGDTHAGFPPVRTRRFRSLTERSGQFYEKEFVADPDRGAIMSIHRKAARESQIGVGQQR
jgi:hypothetical protein